MLRLKKKIKFILVCLTLLWTGFSTSLCMGASTDQPLSNPQTSSEGSPNLTQDIGIPPPPVPYEAAFTKMIATLIGLVLFVILTVWILRRIGQGKFRGFGSHRSIEILEKKPLSPKTILYLISLEGKKILVAESQLEVKKLDSIDKTSQNLQYVED